jgi:acetyl-CoA acetyltransferase
MSMGHPIGLTGVGQICEITAQLRRACRQLAATR